MHLKKYFFAGTNFGDLLYKGVKSYWLQCREQGVLQKGTRFVILKIVLYPEDFSGIYDSNHASEQLTGSWKDAHGVEEQTRLCLFKGYFIGCAAPHLGSSLPPPGMEPMPPAVEVQSPKHWTSRELSNLQF
ncbi:uncharacterized protein LOC130849042 [Hippopotamus amphibius kiboko]|uniref:uncharacterized protein LOC130849042 n=1 Tax=Hippopotamus amphibius kiboko TaxID=575201 RepID=UPI0025980511|nr:uncharacterized protein LOC130849042 [Hippopotamus amphibius kiboko]XP_057583581.1 uncharacterized protein LOC130849042 [Hippopotamus amphibius kiboko]XP_057583582.1 uncharacterized protein LOC130849042 [Hippopotamus amphibius kiboko]XP_057583583.1 uncharacterized protein LOC130849042 [Hippopotamus amphibius kiboko]XP_057583584.1 uncharacterized protein LOC130849042 [Hippopotamus amphibius kiboko]XP_057583585.1 uncharacterized protein LOC130849042 [Hippopotamus amphibius kiboko]